MEYRTSVRGVAHTEPDSRRSRPKRCKTYQYFCIPVSYTHLYNENLRTALSEYIYVSDGTEKVITPHFTYYGYRYVKVTGIRDLSCEDFTALVLYSDYESIGAIETGNDLVNKLISNIEWGMKGNFLDVPTDCPQRDERMGWTGDTPVSYTHLDVYKRQGNQRKKTV